MKVWLATKDAPIWEFKDFKFNEINFDNPKIKWNDYHFNYSLKPVKVSREEYSKRGIDNKANYAPDEEAYKRALETNKSNPAFKRDILDVDSVPWLDWKVFSRDFTNQITLFQDLLLEKIFDYERIRSLWPEKIQELRFDNRYDEEIRKKPKWEIMRCRPGFKQRFHYDNRQVLGVFVLNLTDNPEGSNTRFNITSPNHNVKDLKYSGPVKKRTGHFWLNAPETFHGVKNSSDKNRYILYWPIGVGHLFANDYKHIKHVDLLANFKEWKKEYRMRKVDISEDS
jgi:hypothetical protein